MAVTKHLFVKLTVVVFILSIHSNNGVFPAKFIGQKMSKIYFLNSLIYNLLNIIQ